jgi:cell division protein FtsW (lipid II flippase)
MKATTGYPEFDSFVNTVCSQVRAKQLHRDIRYELTAHLEEHMEDNLAKGMSLEDACLHAVASMGEPEGIGRDLDKTHRPRTDWGLLLLVVLLSGVGLLAMYNVQMNSTNIISHMLFERKIVFVCIGMFLMGLLWVFDYQKLKKYSEYFYAVGIVILWVTSYTGEIMNGQRGWLSVGAIGLHTPTIAIFMLLIGLAGMKSARLWSWKEGMLQFVYRGLLPLFLLMNLHVMTLAMVYMAVCMIHLWFTRRSLLQLTSFVTASVGILLIIVVKSNYLQHRIRAALHWTDDPQGAGYQLTQFLAAMRSAGWWGTGMGTPNTRIPYVHSEGLLPYFIYCLGWGAGIIVLMLIFAFICRSVVTITYIKDEFGKRLSAVIGTLFIVESIWSVAMVFGYAPIVGLSLPFLSYGGTDQLTQFIAVGLLLSIYRRRNMISVRHSAESELV